MPIMWLPSLVRPLKCGGIVLMQMHVVESCFGKAQELLNTWICVNSGCKNVFGNARLSLTRYPEI